MKAYLVTLLIIDHDGLGAQGIESEIRANNWANDCIMPRVVETREADIGEWESAGDALQQEEAAYEKAAKFLEKDIATMQGYADAYQQRMKEMSPAMDRPGHPWEEEYNKLQIAKAGKEARIATLTEAAKVFRGWIRTTK